MTNPLFDLTGETAVVTGAGRGIGKGMARTLADAGCNIVCAPASEGVTGQCIRIAGKP